MTRQISIQIDPETARQIAELAGWWGLTEKRHNTPVIVRCIERVWAIEKMARRDGVIDWFAAVDEFENESSH